MNASFNSTPVLIDWLSISGKSRGVKPDKLKCVRLPYGTSVFKQIEELFYDTDRIATVSSKPYSPVIDADLHQIKFDNWVLYSSDFYNLFDLVIKESRIYNYKISRIDICRDFNTFNKGLSPVNLIKGFLSRKYIKLGKSKYSVWGETNKVLSYDYLSFGRKSSLVNVYLYNKSLEMNQVTYKPHIVNKWLESNLKTVNPVYRLEVSIKESDISLVKISTGENFQFNIDNIFIQDDIETLFNFLISKYFHFKYNTGQKNISREKSLNLTHIPDFDSLQWEPRQPVTTNRSDKIFLKKLDQLYNELRLDDVQLFNKIQDIRELFSKLKHLQDFYDDKIIPETLNKLDHPSYHEPGIMRRYIRRLQHSYRLKKE